MKRILMKAKVHGVTVTAIDLNYEGSLILDESLMEAAGMIPYEQVQVYNLSNGERFLSYLIKGDRDSGVVGINGVAAHKVKIGDELMIATYVLLEEGELDFFIPKILIADKNNRIKEAK